MDRYGWNRLPFSVLVGKTLTAIDGYKDGSDEVVFTTSEGEKYHMFHDQNCCESVTLVDAGVDAGVDGGVADLLGSPVTHAASETLDAKKLLGDRYDSVTWTFYSLTAGYSTITMRWVGESSGYYSEEVDFALDPKTAVNQGAPVEPD